MVNAAVSSQLLPWHQTSWQQFLQAYTQQRLPHALLISTSRGLGALQLAQQIAQLVLCEKTSQVNSCGTCPTCQLFAAGTHPDYFLLQPEEDSNVIKIDVIRQLSNKITQSAQQSGYKVVIIEPADALNLAASNALLKTLEEPTANTLLILVSAHSERLLATLRSRCQYLRISAVGIEEGDKWLQAQGITEAEQWLALAEGAPLLAMELANDVSKQTIYADFMQKLQIFQEQLEPIEIAKYWASLDAKTLAIWLSQFYMDLIRLATNVPVQFIVHQSYTEWLQIISTHYSLPVLFAAYDKIIALQKLLLRTNNVNVQLQIEATLIDIIKIYNQ